MSSTDMIDILWESALGLQKIDPKKSNRIDILSAALCKPLKVSTGLYMLIPNGGSLQYLFSCPFDEHKAMEDSNMFSHCTLNDQQIATLRKKQVLCTSYNGKSICWCIAEDLYVYAFYGINITRVSDVFKKALLTMVIQTTTFLRQSHMIRSAQRAMNTDPLTQLPNRRKLHDLWSEVVVQLGSGHISTVYLAIGDVDHFKSVNDNYGHTAGDAVLKAIAKVLRSSLSPGEYVGRWGGEEFVLMVLSKNRLTELHQKVQELLVETCDKNGTPVTLQVTMTIGVLCVHHYHAAIDTTARSLSNMLVSPDQALYSGKNSGRNQIVFVSK